MLKGVLVSVYDKDNQLSFRFSRKQRLLTPKEYKSVFENPLGRFKSQHFLLLVKRNQLESARLGTVIAKKQIKKAHDRNTIKRLVRESFRLRQHELRGIDIVFLAYRSLESLNNVEISKCLDEYWLKLMARYRNS